MSDDFIIVQCPNCGYSLKIGINVTEYKCEFCGLELLIRQTAAGVSVEMNARCPICNKNDRVEKVSSILNSQVKKSETALAKFLMPPKPPQLDPGPGVINWASCSSIPLFLFAAGIQLVFIWLAISYDRSTTVSVPIIHIISFISIGVVVAGVPFGIGLLLQIKGAINWARYSSILLFILSAGLLVPSIRGIIYYISVPNRQVILPILEVLIIEVMSAGIGSLLLLKVAPKVQEKNDAKNEIEAERIAAVKADIERQKLDWEMDIERYRKLYYCHRDDVVFVPGETGSVPADSMKDLLLK